MPELHTYDNGYTAAYASSYCVVMDPSGNRVATFDTKTDADNWVAVNAPPAHLEFGDAH